MSIKLPVTKVIKLGIWYKGTFIYYELRELIVVITLDWRVTSNLITLVTKLSASKSNLITLLFY